MRCSTIENLLSTAAALVDGVAGGGGDADQPLPVVSRPVSGVGAWFQSGWAIMSHRADPSQPDRLIRAAARTV